jgi:hypothetical protein
VNFPPSTCSLIVARTTPSETILCPKGWKKEVIDFNMQVD